MEIPKPDGGIRKLGIPAVKDRIFQQAITQRLTPVHEPLFSENSYGYRPGKSAKDAIQKVKEYAEQGYTHAVAMDLSKYFDTLNHEILLNILRRKDVYKRQIGESRAEDIIRYRETYGGFQSIEDIMNVSGIKDAAFEKIKDSITV